MQVKFMQRALELAQKAAKEDEVPIGAVIVLIVASFLKDARKYMEEKGINT